MSWDLFISYTFKALLLPPSINLIMMVLAAILFKKFYRTAISLIIINFTILFLCSLPSISHQLIKSIESKKAISNALIKQIANEQKIPRAIVVLSGGRISLAPEYGEIDTVNSSTLQRLQYARWLQKRTNLPVLLSGGSVFNEATAEAVLMNQVMVSSFNIAPKWIESKSKNTAENAIYSVPILHQNNINEILLVTHAWHMPRARKAFEKQGIKVIEAATVFEANRERKVTWVHFLPNAKALERSNRALHEILAEVWYKIRY